MFMYVCIYFLTSPLILFELPAPVDSLIPSCKYAIELFLCQSPCHLPPLGTEAIIVLSHPSNYLVNPTQPMSILADFFLLELLKTLLFSYTVV